MERNQWSPCTGMGGRHAPDFTPSLLIILLTFHLLFYYRAWEMQRELLDWIKVSYMKRASEPPRYSGLILPG